MPYLVALITAVMLLLAAPIAHAAPSPRDTAGEIARAVEDNYFDPAKGKAIADDLRAAAARGEFDRFDNPRVLAVELTRRLKPLDAHFNVEYSAEAAAGSPRQGPAPQPGPAAAPQGDPFRRGNYGFRRVEILPGNLGYIDMRVFAHFDFADDAAPARRAADAALRMVAGADAVIIDLRNNGGGSPAMVGYMTSAFTPPGADIYNTFHSRQGTSSEAPARPYPTPNLEAPVYILISGRTGSAAEALAYTLKNAGRAIIVGEASAGAANPGDEIRVAGGFRIFVSDGSPRSPITGRNWEGTGVIPDVAVPAAEAFDEAQRLALRATAAKLAGAERTEAEWALAALSPAPVAGQDLAEFAGAYSGLEVSAQDGRLRIVRGRRPAQVMVPIGKDLFRDVTEPSRRIRFNRDAQGRITALEYVFPDGPAGLYRRDA